jgi:M6 family metalloprotease-like protein
MTKRVVVLLVLASAAVAFADSRIVSPRDASLEALTAALEQGHGGDELAAVAAERQARLSNLVQTDAARVLREALSGPTRSNLPPRVRDFVEERVEFEGTLEVLVEDRDDGSQMHFSLELDSGDRYALYFVSQPTNLLTDERVRVSGLRIDNAIAIESGQSDIRRVADATTSSVEATSALSTTFGAQKTVILLVNFSNNPAQPYTTAQAKSGTFTTTSNFDLETSYGQTWLTGDVFGWYTIPLTSTVCDPTSVRSLAQSAATAAGVNLSNYDHYVYAFPGNACAWWGLGTIGGNPSHAWINGSLALEVLGHEMGHNFGLYHAHSLNCGNVVLGATCTMTEYGDTVDMMGLIDYHFNAYEKERLGWLNYGTSPPLTTVTASGTYTIGPLETMGSESKALKIPRDALSFFYVELRRGLGFDGGLGGNPNISNGVIVHLASPSNPNSSTLLDMTVEHSSYPSNPALTVGQNFTDSTSGVSITVNSVSATGASVAVALNGAPPPPPPPPSTCTHVAPAVSLVPSPSTGVAAGTAVSFTLSVTNKDVSPCTASVFNLAASVPSGWAGALTAASLSVSPGASSSTTLKVTAPTSAINGSYTVSSSATNSTAATASTSASAAYVVSNPPPPPPPPGCTHVAPAVSLVPSPSTSVAAGTAVSFTLSVTNKDVSPCTASVFNLASSVPSGWTGALTAASLSVLPGASASKPLTVTSPTSATNGSYTVNSSATNSTAATASASASAPYVVSNPLGGSGGTFSDNFNRADSSSLGSSWTGVSGSLVVAGTMAKSALGVTGNHVALVSILSGGTETAEADFTSVDNNLGPRFGVILRYKDSKNYYQIYRQTGGSSRLLVSKFVNGVETILGMTSVANPAKGVTFHIKGQVAGATLTLDFDGVRRVTTYDSTFTTGKVGILIGNGGKTYQQQADNFSATVQ